MYYSFYIYLILLALISPIIAFNKKDILKKCSLNNYIFYTSLVITILIGLKKLYERDSFFPKIDKNIQYKLVLQSIVIILLLFISGSILMKENVFVYKSLHSSVHLIILLVYSILVMKIHITTSMMIGLLFIIVGSYLIDDRI